MRRVVGVSVLGLLAALLPAMPVTASILPVTPYMIDHRLVEAETVDGTVLDVTADRLLYIDTADPPMLNIRDLATNVVTVLPPIPGFQHLHGWLTPRGAVFTVREPFGSLLLYEYSGGDDLTELGLSTGYDPPIVKGSFVVWRDFNGNVVYRRDLSADVTVTVAEGAFLPELADDGDVLYSSSNRAAGAYEIRRYHDGVTSRVPTPTDSVSAEDAIADGSHVVYTRGNGIDDRTVDLYDGTTNQVLSATPWVGVLPGARFDAAGGWTAFQGGGPDGNQISVRSPAGAVSQLSDFPSDVAGEAVQIVAVNDSGETVFAWGDAMYLGRPGQAPVNLVTGLGYWASQRQASSANFARYVNGHWMFGVAGALFELVDGPLVPLTVSLAGPGAVGIAPYGDVCYSTCSYQYVPGTLLYVSAAGDQGWRLTGWNGSCTGAGDQTCRLTLDGPGSTTATFGRLPSP